MRMLKVGLLAVATVSLVVVAVVLADEEKIALDKLPKGVLETVKARFTGAEMVEAVKEVKTFYEVTIKQNGQKIDVTLEGGEIVSIEKQITAKALPPAARISSATASARSAR